MVDLKNSGVPCADQLGFCEKLVMDGIMRLAIRLRMATIENPPALFGSPRSRACRRDRLDRLISLP